MSRRLYYASLDFWNIRAKSYFGLIDCHHHLNQPAFMKLRLLNPLRWPRKALWLILVGAIAIWFLFLDTYSLWTRWELSSRREELAVRTEKLKKENAKLEKKIKALEKDPQLLEKIAREKYGMHKPGEKVYKVKEDD